MSGSRLYGDDGELFRLMETELFVAVVGDVMDTIGLQHQFGAACVRDVLPVAVQDCAFERWNLYIGVLETCLVLEDLRVVVRLLALDCVGCAGPAGVLVEQ